MRFPTREKVASIRMMYPAGTRVRLLSMDDPQAPPIGTMGTVQCIDDIGSLMVNWDNGSSLNVLYGIDSVQIVSE